MAPSATRRTVEEVREMQAEDRAWPRYELIDGELIVTQGPTRIHQRAIASLLVTLDRYLEGQVSAEALFSSSDLELAPNSLVQPDVFVYPQTEHHHVREWEDVKCLLLAVEITSPASGHVDRVTKRRFFARLGVTEYWVVDLDGRIVERTPPGEDRPEMLDERLEWSFPGASEPFVLDVVSFFSEIHDE